MEKLPPNAHLVLVGGGHCNVQLIRSFWNTKEFQKITLITDQRLAPYSGMLTGMLAGHYSPSECHFDLKEIAHRARVDIVIEPAVEITDGEVITPTRKIPYSLAVVNIGARPAQPPDLPNVPKISLKPIHQLLKVWPETKSYSNIGVIGGGAAGIEVAFMLRDQGRNVTVFEREPEILHSLAPRLRRLVSDLATKQGISIQRSISPTAKIDFAILATPAAPPVALTNLPRASDGFFRVDSYLRATPAVFAAGDCISFGVPKAGVFAVREAKVIAHNLRALLRGSSLTPYHPQKNYLVLLALGKTGVAAARGKFATFHPLFRFWKDKIDRKFMRKFGANAYPSRPT